MFNLQVFNLPEFNLPELILELPNAIIHNIWEFNPNHRIIMNDMLFELLWIANRNRNIDNSIDSYIRNAKGLCKRFYDKWHLSKNINNLFESSYSTKNRTQIFIF
jgi:hypothetical protein